jgi:hypothetical protein
MTTGDITATFGPAQGDRTTLSKSCRATLDGLFRHPLSHNLEWSDVIALFSKLGSVEHKSNNEVAFAIGGEHHLLRTSHGKDLPADDVVALRHMLTRAGWSPETAKPTPDMAAPEVPAGPPDLLVAVGHHEARIYRLDLAASDQADNAIRPYDPHHFLHHLSHKDQSRERGQRAAEDPGFYAEIAEAVRDAGRIVVVGHGKGHADAGRHLTDYLRLHHKDIFPKVGPEIHADLSALTPPELLALGRRSLSDHSETETSE